MNRTSLFALFSPLILLVSPTLAADPDMLQDLCVADYSSTAKVNGFACKPTAAIIETDFSFTGANVEKILGLNTLGISMSRIDYAPGGLNPPHTHPRATEMAFVLEGQIDVGFITTTNKLITKIISQGQDFRLRRGLVHFQKNSGNVAASVIAAVNSQLPGTQSLAMTLFGSTPVVPDNVLTRALQIGTREVEKIKGTFAPKK